VGWEVVKLITKFRKASQASIVSGVNFPRLWDTAKTLFEALGEPVEVFGCIEARDINIVGIRPVPSLFPTGLASHGNLVPSGLMHLVQATSRTRVPNSLGVIRGLNLGNLLKHLWRCGVGGSRQSD
jgi:hypothetical protein